MSVSVDPAWSSAGIDSNSERGSVLSVAPRIGIGVFICADVWMGRFVALEITAFSKCVRLGFMPQARHAGNGVWAPALGRSKLEGTGFEKVQMGQIQVALLAGTGSGGGRWNGLSTREAGDAVALLDGAASPAICLF